MHTVHVDHYHCVIFSHRADLSSATVSLLRINVCQKTKSSGDIVASTSCILHQPIEI